jgi:prefoldin subunit 5
MREIRAEGDLIEQEAQHIDAELKILNSMKQKLEKKKVADIFRGENYIMEVSNELQQVITGVEREKQLIAREEQFNAQEARYEQKASAFAAQIKSLERMSRRRGEEQVKRASRAPGVGR